jgi:general secretion pathway protein G
MTRGRRAVRSGFTLIEVMIVLAIVLALAGLVGVVLFQRQDQAKVDLTKYDLQAIKKAMDFFRFDFGRYPTDEEGVAVLWDRELLGAEVDAAKYTEYLAEPLAEDRWGNEWGYRAESETREGMYDLWSIGPDGEEGTEDDISLWASVEDVEDGMGLGEPAGGP